MKLRKNAFTLIELLVVIAIIAILAAILFPVFAQAKAAAKKTACLSNLKQMSLATQIYGNDYDDFMPASFTSWDMGAGDPLGFMDPNLTTMTLDSGYGTGGDPIQNATLQQIYPYVKNFSLLQCPTASATTNAGWTEVTGPGLGDSSYIFNGAVGTQSVTRADQIANLIVWQEGPQVTRVSFVQPSPWNYLTPQYMNGVDIGWAGVIHGGTGGNYAFADGHAKYMPRNGVSWANMGSTGTHWDGNTGNLVPNTAHMYLQTAAQNFWFSCGTFDIGATLTTDGGAVCG